MLARNCHSCGVRLHAADGHAECLSCLGASHARDTLNETECPHCESMSTQVLKADALALHTEVENLLGKGAIELVPPDQIESGFYSRYFLVPKKDGCLCPMLGFSGAYGFGYTHLVLHPHCPSCLEGSPLAGARHTSGYSIQEEGGHN